MTSSGKKPWETPWTAEQMIENAPNWSLAGDVALLKTLEAFSENMFKKTRETDDRLNRMLRQLDETELKLDITKNEFLSLHNRQFVESRVYEEDETVEAEEKEKEPIEKPQTEEEATKDMKEAVLVGLKMIEKYYYKSEVPVNNSDNDSDDSLPLYALTLKDPYISRPLPHVIGTREWHEKWHVGLEETSSSESDNESTSEKFSETDSETDVLPISNRPEVKGVSDSSSDGRPDVNSTFNKKDLETLGSSGSELEGSAPVKAPISSSNFAEQLAAKLGSVISQQLPREEEEEVNKRPIQKANSSTNRFATGMFPDEPPPLDEDEDEENIFEGETKKGLFSGGQGLFDDEITVKKQEQETKQLPIQTGLFDKEEEDDDLFNPSVTKPAFDIKKPFLSSFAKTTVPLYEDEPPELDSDTNNKPQQKPIDDIPQKEPSIEKSKVSLFDNIPQKEPSTEKSKVSLFDDDDDLFEDDLFSNISAKKFTSSLFDDLPPDDDVLDEKKPRVDFFDPNPPPDTNNWDTKSEDDTKPVFDEEPSGSSERKDEGLFAGESLFATSKSEIDGQAKKFKSLFDDDDETEADDLFSNLQNESSGLCSNSKEIKTKEVESRLFATDGFSETDHLFSKILKSEGKVETVEKSEKITGDLFSKIPERKKESTEVEGEKTSLFGSEDLMEDLFSKKEEEKRENGSSKSSIAENNVMDDEKSSLLANDALMEDLFSESESYAKTVQKEKEVFEDGKPDLFSGNLKNDQKDMASVAKASGAFSEADDLLFKNTKNDAVPTDDEKQVAKASDSVEPVEKPFQTTFDPIPSLNATKQELFKQKPPTSPESPKQSQPKVSPGKLKINKSMSINVKALMPGAVPPPSLVKSRSLEMPREEEEEEEGKVEEGKASSEVSLSGEERGVEFREGEGEVATLSSVTKNRAKIPAKRRPSTRRARQEQIRKSMPDFRLAPSEPPETTPITDSPIFVQVRTPETAPEPSRKKGKPLFTKEEPPAKSLFDSPDSDSDDLFKEDAKKTVITANLFEKDDGLFGTRKPALKKSETIDIFNDGDDMEEVFSAKKLPPPKSNLIKKSLFDDDLDDEDDIFGSGPSSMAVPARVESDVVKPQKVNIRKLDATSMEDDPLDALKRDE